MDVAAIQGVAVEEGVKIELHPQADIRKRGKDGADGVRGTVKVVYLQNLLLRCKTFGRSTDRFTQLCPESLRIRSRINAPVVYAVEDDLGVVGAVQCQLGHIGPSLKGITAGG